MTTIPRVPDDLLKVSDEALEKLYNTLAEAREELRVEAKRISIERDSRLADVAAAERVQNMGNPEKLALLQAIQASGVDSDEKVGEA